MKIDVQNVKDALYIEFLAYEKNTVKMNNLYKKNKEEAYSKMKNSELNEFKFINQATIRKKMNIKKQ